MEEKKAKGHEKEVENNPAIEEAFNIAFLVTIVGSTIPFSYLSTHLPFLASNP